MDVAVFVNSSDGFQDCWPPFFQLFSRYGGQLRDAPIYLNTERAGFAWPNLNLKATAVWPQDELQRPSWSECLMRGLRAVPEKYVLYLQEDYFLKDEVRTPAISDAMTILRDDPQVGVVYLVNFGPQFRKYRQYSDGVVEILPPVRYLVSAQAAIWRKDFLISLARPWENGWMFEKFASGRARRCRHKFLSINPGSVSQPAIDYIFTGIIKGRWKVDCVPFFAREGIEMDFSKRGFFRERGRLKSRVGMFGKFVASPRGAVRSLASLVD